MTTGKQIRYLWCAAVLTLLASACGQWRMVDTETRMQRHAAAGDYQQALALLRAERTRGYKAQDSVMYWMNEGMLLHLTGRYSESIIALTLAEERSKALFTRSISNQVEAAFSSDAALDYQGEDHEKVLLNVFKALDFLALGDHSGALVEARKINLELEYMNTAYREHPNRYAEDAFAHWLMGMLFELEGSYDDARIALQHARRVYREQFGPRYGVTEPDFVAEDLARVALLGGDEELMQALRADRTDRAGPRLGWSHEAMKTQGEVILIHLNGESPKKTDLRIRCGAAKNQPFQCDHQPGGSYMVERALVLPPGGTHVDVAFPRLESKAPVHASITMSASASPGRATSQVALPIDRIAHQTLADKLPRVFAHAVIRVIAKLGSKKAADKAGDKLASKGRAGAVLGFLVSAGTDAAMDLSEEADKRTWSTLPARIEVARLHLPPGTHDIVLTLPDGTIKTTIRGVQVRAGERVFLTHRSIP
jgi:tetratricopeptide (TPR) repeat protein